MSVEQNKGGELIEPFEPVELNEKQLKNLVPFNSPDKKSPETNSPRGVRDVNDPRSPRSSHHASLNARICSGIQKAIENGLLEERAPDENEVEE